VHPDDDNSRHPDNAQPAPSSVDEPSSVNSDSDGERVYRGLAVPVRYEAKGDDTVPVIDEDQVSAASLDLVWCSPATELQDALAGIDLQKEGVDTTVGQVVPVADFSDFYRTNYLKLRRGLGFLFRRNLDMAEDIAQQSFITVFNNWDRISATVRNPYGYVYVIAVRLALRWIDTQRKDLERAKLVAAALPGESGVTDLDLRLDMVGAIGQLPEHERIVVTMALVMGDRPAEIGRALNRPAATVRVQLKRGMARLIKIIGDLGEGEDVR
jgi:RNA polymerase sigma factor (sigma-70 family)